jgi:aspartyl-tRNA(Asn)/glutamyl-tRNA(Gln) amidotransferase subunit C
MKITEELVEYVAALSRIQLNAAQTREMRAELEAILEYMEVLNTADTENIEPLSHVFPISNVMRPDEVRESFDRALLLENAPEHTEETVIVPKTVE